jgi:polyhydroxybutyrate depolymerase
MHPNGSKSVADSIKVGQLTRTFRLYRPAGMGRRPGLVFVLHGTVGSGIDAEGFTSFNRCADRLKWIVAYPDAHNPGIGGGWRTFATDAQSTSVDDVAFAAAIVRRLESEDGVDPDRIYVAGWSRGAMMAHRLGCELSEMLAGIATVAGNLATPSGSIVDIPRKPSKPVPVMVVHGTSDRVVPIEGGPSPKYPQFNSYAPLSDVLSAWRSWNECNSREVVSESGPVTIRTWRSDSGCTVELRLITGGTHTWPGPPRHSPPDPDGYLDASNVIADFFAVHPRMRTEGR